MKFATTLRTSRAQAIIDAAGTNPKMKFYTGTEALSPAGTLLATLNITGALGNVTNGVIIGAFYVLMALGLSLILNLSNVINFAHGGFLVVGGYIAYTITPYVGFWGALLIAPPRVAVFPKKIQLRMVGAHEKQ